MNLIEPLLVGYHGLVTVYILDYITTNFCSNLHKHFAVNFKHIKETHEQVKKDSLLMLKRVYFSRIKDRTKSIKELVSTVLCINKKIDPEVLHRGNCEFDLYKNDGHPKIRIYSIYLLKEIVEKKEMFDAMIGFSKSKEFELMCLDFDNRIAKKMYKLLAEAQAINLRKPPY